MKALYLLDFIGASGEIRTPGPQVRSLVLYPTELRTHKAAYYLEGVQGSQGKRRAKTWKTPDRIQRSDFTAGD